MWTFLRGLPAVLFFKRHLTILSKILKRFTEGVL